LRQRGPQRKGQGRQRGAENDTSIVHCNAPFSDEGWLACRRITPFATALVHPIF
jgi:hypothetical protein